MEKFAVDLDRVLDEFELNEDLALEPADGRECGLVNYETPVARSESYIHNDLHNIQKSNLNSRFPESVENFLDLSEADFAPTKSTTIALVHKPKPQINNGSHNNDLIRLAPEQKKIPNVALAPHKLENNTSTLNGLKVVHSDEPINKTDLLNFDGNWDAPTVNSPSSVQKSVEEVDCMQSTPENLEHPVLEASVLNDEIQDEGISMEECETEAVHHNLNRHNSVTGVDATVSPVNNAASEDNSEETFVTPEHNDQPCMEIIADRPLIGFGGDIEITDEEMQQYLEEKDIVASGAVADSNHARVEKEEFFTPMVENQVGLIANEDIYHESSRSGLVDFDENESKQEFEVKADTRKDSIVNSDLLVLEISDDVPSDKGALPEQESDQIKEQTYHSYVSDADQGSGSCVNKPKHSHQDVERNSEVVEQCQPMPKTIEKVKERRSRSKKQKPENVPEENVSDIIVEVQHNADVDVDVISPASIDDGYDANLYVSEQNINDGTIPPEAYDDLSESQLRLQRPTSLHLPGKIAVTPPSNDVVQELSDAEGNKSFASLMATAGSPDAGLGISPGSLDELETPGNTDSSQVLLTEEERHLGKVAPVWVPDAEAPNCMQCDAKFTVIKRRHHCRACGKVLCAQCCGLKAKLHYMENKEARVCQFCLEIMEKVLLLEQTSGGVAGAAGSTDGPTDAWRPSQPSQNRAPNPNNPSEYCSIIPPLQQCLANANAPPPTVMVPVGVLKRGGDGRPRGEPKQVMFSDGIRPGGDLTELDGPEPKLPFRRQGRLQKKVERPQGQAPAVTDLSRPSPEQREYSLNDDLDMDHILSLLKDEALEPLVFVLIKNLRVLVNILNLDCCVHKTCWSFTTRGMVAVGQDEIVILLEVLPDEKAIPYDIFYHIMDIFDEAGKGVTVSGMGHTVFTRSCLGSRDHGGFLFVHPTFQCLQKIPLPPSPYLFGVLLQKWEIPWAKVFPLRLLLRLGHEFRYYPLSLVGIRFRKPVFCEIGHTIVNLLADFRNYQYSLPAVPGLVIHMKDKQTYICCPRNRYDEMVKALNSSIDHVLALAASFSSEADSHLVCVQNEDGNYQTQAINIKDKPRKVTGASFVVFNGALKSSSGLTAKSSIVEDGLMVQIPGDSMLALRQALRDMRDYVVPCGPIGAENPDEVVHVVWVDDDQNVNVGVKSPIDGMAMDGISSIRIHCGTDYVGDGHLIRWTEVYLIRTDDGVGSRRSDPVDVSKVSDTLAQAGCVALAQHLGSLYSAGFTRIGLRVTLDSDNVGYEIGAGGQRLSADYMNDLDSALVPAIHCAASPNQEGSVLLELVFHIIQQ